MKDSGMAYTFSACLDNSSLKIYELALKKVKNFISGRILETRIAGKIAASLCRVLCKIRPEKGLAAFLPVALRKISSLIKEETSKDQNLDNELMFNLLIMSEVDNKTNPFIFRETIFLIHSADLQSRPVGIIVFVHVRPSVPTFQT